MKSSLSTKKNSVIAFVGLFLCAFSLRLYGHFKDTFDDTTGALVEVNHSYEYGDLKMISEYSSWKPFSLINHFFNKCDQGGKFMSGPFYIDESVLFFCQMQWLEKLNQVETRNQFRALACIETDGYILRPIIPQHRDYLKRLFGVKEEVEPFYEDGKAWDDERLERRLTGWVNRWDFSPFSAWLVFNKETNAFVMFISSYFHADKNSVEVAYITPKRFRNKGIASEILKKFEAYVRKNGFICEGVEGISDESLDYIHAPIDPTNEASKKLVQKCGFHHEETLDYFSDSYKAQRLWFRKRIK